MHNSANTVRRAVIGAIEARRITNELFSKSQWFAVEPWPDDHWTITVMAENERLLEQLVSGVVHREIRHTLVLSCAHAPDDAAGLEAVERWGTADAYGWTFHTAKDQAQSDRPPWLLTLLAAAADIGCTYLRLDRDGPIDRHLPAFDG